MGCGNSTDASSKGGEKSAGKQALKVPSDDKKYDPQASPSYPQPDRPVPPPKTEAPLSEHLSALAPLFCEKQGRDSRAGKDRKFLITAVPRADGLEIGVLTGQGDGDYFQTDIPVAHILDAVRPSVSPAVFVAELKRAFSNGTVLVDVSSTATVRASIGEATFGASLSPARPADRAALSRVFIAPLFHFWSGRKATAAFKAESEAVRSEVSLNLLRLAAADVAKARDARRRLDRVTGTTRGNGRTFDPTSPGPHLFALHLDAAAPHSPVLFEHNDAALALIRRKYSEANDSPDFVTAPSDSELKKLLDAVPRGQHDAIVRSLECIDEWGFDVLHLADITRGGALFHATYALLYKYGLIGYFQFDHGTLVRFLTALEAGYHPNHYHNATHAADVLQCVHYILSPGGLATHLSLSPEEIFSAILASSMHDFGHPGFNNLFHVKTSAYLATLYNDRSVLENHHCASVFELLRHDCYNILGHLPDDQRKEIRETVVEMVLATDMGLHSKIFSQFKSRLRDLAADTAKGGAAWRKADDRRLALSVALKMADISNCARPPKLYHAWASRIADEFYVQGDVERELGLALSPFMDRTKHEKDFAKGQKAFMNFIVIPLFEAGADFLPELHFTVASILQNKDHWDAQE